VSQGLPRGLARYEFTGIETGEERTFELAWPGGLQEGLSQPVAIISKEWQDALPMANAAGFRCFTSIDEFKVYVQKDVLSEATAA
jgi:hypothetical protein